MTFSERQSIDITAGCITFTLLQEDMAVVTGEGEGFLMNINLKTGVTFVSSFEDNSYHLAAVTLGRKSALASSDW